MSQTASAEGFGQSLVGTCTDDAGNTYEATEAGISIDRTPPSVTWTGMITDGAQYLFGSVPAAPSCTAGDTFSGPKDCVVDGYGTAVGQHTLTATALDLAGISTTEMRTYEVLAWTLRGFRAPVTMNGCNVAQAGSNVPLKFQLFSGDVELTSTSVVSSFDAVPVACPDGAPSADLAPGTGFGALRYDANAGFFSLDWKTPKSSGACVAVSITTLDGSALTASFSLK